MGTTTLDSLVTGDVVTVGTAASARAARPRILMGLLWATWALCAALALGFLVQPVGPTAQLALCGAAGAGMVVLWLLFPRRGLARMLFLALGTTVVIRYVYWRLTGTLPALDDPVSFGLGVVLALAELYCVLILTVSLIINVEPLARGAAPTLPEAELPTVDIFIPSYNESVEILGVTLAAARNLDYPAGRACVWLLDDGGTDQKCADADPARAETARSRRAELQALCAALGARYLTRARNEHAKAGNLNNGLTQARADLILVLDADHAPFRPFLRETVGLFAQDPKLFLVQTPHVFINPDPLERNLRTFTKMPSENEMFYGVTQAGLDKWNGSFFCGSAALLRRAALDAVGGFSGITITEDCETAFELHARGWTSAYVDRPLIAGLQPETFADFIGQRARWCQGMFQIMLLKNPLLKRGLKPIQRLCYLSSMTFWFFPLPRLIFMLAPLLHIFFDVKIFVSSIDEALAFTATYVAANMMMQNYLYGRVRWPWVSELYEYVQGVYLARSIVSVMLSPRKPSFNVTNKGVGLDHDHLSSLAWPFFAIFGALVAGCATAAWRYLFEPGVTSLMLVVGLWCLFNLVIAGAALGVVAERRQPERSHSLPVKRRAVASVGGAVFEVMVERASAEGCRLHRCDGSAWPVSAGAGSVGRIVLAEAACGPLTFRQGSGLSGETWDVTFTDSGPAMFRSLAELMYGDVSALRAFLSGRHRHENLLSGSLRFLVWGVTEPVRAITYAVRDRRSVPPVAQPLTAPAVAVPDRPTPTEIPSASAGSIRAYAAEEPSTLIASPVVAPAIAPDAAPLAATLPPLATVPVPLIVPANAETPIQARRAAPPAQALEAGASVGMPLTDAAWRRAVAELAAAEAPAALTVATPAAASIGAAAETRLDPAAWLAEIFALAGVERAEANRADLVRGPDFRALGREPVAPATIRSAA
ncbi:UDP-forming cellulose synthase catalytic subunit [Methylobacterium sp. GC_Met_2]|uniref:UDP-forming cellulose synthase catalytic subunit n=1 Tax=Methylobacterium sp. GC_Met_2 TaxID=2937376 RepID=UPI00226B27EC|nr:UDP-forming cellulose synthase catalytic subunit [Methylobacterium sp. GC_Met_2]